jgi:hypothetical protein
MADVVKPWLASQILLFRTVTSKNYHNALFGATLPEFPFGLRSSKRIREVNAYGRGRIRFSINIRYLRNC